MPFVSFHIYRKKGQNRTGESGRWAFVYSADFVDRMEIKIIDFFCASVVDKQWVLEYDM
jgi:hypothetical protein